MALIRTIFCVAREIIRTAMERTTAGKLRQQVFKGLRGDEEQMDCVGTTTQAVKDAAETVKDA